PPWPPGGACSARRRGADRWPGPARAHARERCHRRPAGRFAEQRILGAGGGALLVPGGHEAVLSEPSPIIGDIAAAEQAVSFARSVAEGCMTYLVSIETASRILIGATGAAVRQMQAKLDTTLLTGAVKLKDSADAAQRGFALYASSIEAIHRRARSVQQSVDGHLAVIRAETSVLEDISERIGRSAPMSWESPPPPVLPDPALDPTRTVGMDELEEEAARRALVAAHE